MPTETKENYLKAIYFLHQQDTNISVTALGKSIGVSTPTANNMVKKLQEKGWVEYEKYKPLHLTNKGKKAAALIVRKHRIAELFLTKIMGFGWEEVHEIAEDMEHINSEKLFDRMHDMLGKPLVDPHGSPIPDKNGEIPTTNYKLLSDIEEGRRVKFCALAVSSKDLLLHLNRKKISLGAQIDILSKESFDSSMNIKLNNSRDLILSKTVTDKLLVREMS